MTSFGIFKYMACYSLTQFVTVCILYWVRSGDKYQWGGWVEASFKVDFILDTFWRQISVGRRGGGQL